MFYEGLGVLATLYTDCFIRLWGFWQRFLYIIQSNCLYNVILCYIQFDLRIWKCPDRISNSPSSISYFSSIVEIALIHIVLSFKDGFKLSRLKI